MPLIFAVAVGCRAGQLDDPMTDQAVAESAVQSVPELKPQQPWEMVHRANSGSRFVNAGNVTHRRRQRYQSDDA